MVKTSVFSLGTLSGPQIVQVFFPQFKEKRKRVPSGPRFPRSEDETDGTKVAPLPLLTQRAAGRSSLLFSSITS